MSEIIRDVAEMLDDLGMTTAAIRWKQVIESPDLSSYTFEQLMREVFTEQYIEAINKRTKGNLNNSKLTNKSAKIENLKSQNGRRYNDETVKQILRFGFVSSGLNVGIYGKTGAGKSYFTSALCYEACYQNYRCRYVDYCDLLDELISLANDNDKLKKYTKKLRQYSRFRILFIDDFCISRYSEQGIKCLYHLIKTRDELGFPTVFNSQHDPSEWGKTLSDDPECYGMLDGIRRRLTKGFTVQIVLE